ncbi:MAG TPA: hypothetical protein VI997_01570 [Candidatus Thermoplasmatota archaeon]|nr:hypothetical protein [Candidatus Thermoplasmatota archaeon]
MVRDVVAPAASGTLFLAVALVGAVVVLTGALVSEWVASGAGVLAFAAGAAGAVLARAQARAVLRREGLVAEVEAEVQRLDGEITRLSAALARAEDRLRTESEVVKELAKEERAAREIMARRTDRHRDTLERLEARLASLEEAVGREQVKVELRR